MAEAGTALRRAAVGAAAAGGATATVSAAGSVAAAAYLARRILTPERDRLDDVVVTEVRGDTVVFREGPETVVPGRYGLWLDQGAGHARVGDVVGREPDGSVERILLGVDVGTLAPGPARWNAYFHGYPPERSLGVPTRHVLVEGELGPMPAWVIPPAGVDKVDGVDGVHGADGVDLDRMAATSDRWAVLVHGRGALREETLRGVPPVRARGWTVLVPTYRNDEGVPAGPDGRYNLGLSEWRDLEAAVGYAVGHGAREVALGGWSMGGAIILQFLDRSPLSDVVSRVFLDAPVIDWADVLVHHARLHRIPDPLAAFSRTMMGRSWGRRLVGVHEAVDVALTDWVSRGDELHHPILLIHSADDEFVPVGPSRALALRRPDLVRFEEWQVARHCTEWNTDSERWERLVGDFVRG